MTNPLTEIRHQLTANVYATIDELAQSVSDQCKGFPTAADATEIVKVMLSTPEFDYVNHSGSTYYHLADDDRTQGRFTLRIRCL